MTRPWRTDGLAPSAQLRPLRRGAQAMPRPASLSSSTTPPRVRSQTEVAMPLPSSSRSQAGSRPWSTASRTARTNADPKGARALTHSESATRLGYACPLSAKRSNLLDRRRLTALLLSSVTSKRVPGGVVHKLPADLREALIANSTALAAWLDITPLARNEFICWVEDAKQEVTRKRRIRRTQEELEEGQRRPCCWPGCKHRERTGT
jgi:hypothetical protein